MYIGHHITLFCLCIASLLTPIIIHAEEVIFTRENWNVLPHPKIQDFSIQPDGSVTGITVTNIAFIQQDVPNPFGLHIQKFILQEHSHYIVEGLIAYSELELASLIHEILIQKTV